MGIITSLVLLDVIARNLVRGSILARLVVVVVALVKWEAFVVVGLILFITRKSSKLLMEM